VVLNGQKFIDWWTSGFSGELGHELGELGSQQVITLAVRV